ncbi:MAG: hypothetical protein ACAI44_27330 [Candidatus Sericytochromatia bacterium]
MLGTNLTDLEGEKDDVTVSVSETDAVLYFPYNEQAIALIKFVEGSEYNSGDKSWSLPITEENCHRVRDTIDGLREFFQREKGKAELRAQVQLEIADGVLERLQKDFDFPWLRLSALEGDIGVSFPYSAKAVAIMRKVEGRRWDGEEKVWRLPADEEKKIRTALKALRKAIA